MSSGEIALLFLAALTFAIQVAANTPTYQDDTSRDNEEIEATKRRAAQALHIDEYPDQVNDSDHGRKFLTNISADLNSIRRSLRDLVRNELPAFRRSIDQLLESQAVTAFPGDARQQSVLPAPQSPIRSSSLPSLLDQPFATGARGLGQTALYNGGLNGLALSGLGQSQLIQDNHSSMADANAIADMVQAAGLYGQASPPPQVRALQHLLTGLKLDNTLNSAAYPRAESNYLVPALQHVSALGQLADNGQANNIISRFG